MNVYRIIRGYFVIAIVLSFCLFIHVSVYAQSIGTINANNVNVRIKPDLECEVYTQMFTGQQVEILGETEEFYRVFYHDNDSLYIYKQFIDLDALTPAETLADPETPLAAPLIGVIAGDIVNIRKYPTTEHEVLSKAFFGDEFIVTCQCDDWYGIDFNGEDAFVHKDYLKGDNLESVKTVFIDIPEYMPSYGEDETYEMYAIVTSSTGLRLRSQPSTESAILMVFNFGMTMDVLEKQDEWTKVSLDGVIGYVASEYVDLNFGVRPENPFTRGQHIVEFAKQFLGTPYAWGGASLTKGSDCSGFVYSVMKNFGVVLSRSSSSQYGDGYGLPKGELQPGDLVFFDTDGTGRISHVGIYMGGDQFIHSSSSRRTWGVTISSLTEDYYRRTYLKACRVL